MNIDTSNEIIALPYTASYSSQYEIGSEKNTATILNIWKDWDDGEVMRSRDHFADTVTMFFPDGSMISGPRDTVLHYSKLYRDGFTSVTSYPDAWISTRSIDKNEDWVSIWGKEISVDIQGKTDSVYLQESWRLNKKGQVDLMLQARREAAPPKN